MATTPPVSGESLTIFQLNPFVPPEGQTIREAGIPVQLGNANFFVLISQIVASITKNDIGLDQVDNTSDTQKPISLATALALSEKAPSAHRHSISGIDGLAEALAAGQGGALPDNLVLELPGEW